MLESRKAILSSESFKDEFIGTLMPGVISRSNFIQWSTIKNKVDSLKKHLEYFRNLATTKNTDFRKEFADSLLAADKPMDLIETAFQLLAHTGKRYVSDKDLLDFNTFAETEWDEDQASYVANLLTDLGIENVIKTELEDYLLGVQVGLETHRRKNVGGEAFKNMVGSKLNEMSKKLKSEGLDIIVSAEKPIKYSDGKTSKKVDFLLECGSKKIGIEVNFYTSSGSKPTEIKRSYGQVNRELEKVGVELAWVTDGAGYLDMQNSLKEARDIHKNIYNFDMLSKHFEKDLRVYFLGE